MMIAYFFVIHKASVYLNRSGKQRSCQLPVRTGTAGFQPFLNGGNHILPDISGICSGISENLVIFIKPLHNIQSFLCRKSVFLIGFSLKRCQIIKSRRICFLRLFGHRGNSKRFAFYFFYNFFCPFSAESTEASALSVLPGPGDIPCIDCNAKIFLWFKAPDLLLPHGNNGKSGSLHPAAGKLSIILTGKRSCTIHSNQPVCLCSCNRRPVKVVISSSVFQIVKSVFDGLIRNRGYPQSAYGLTAAGFIQDPAGNQLALSSCVCGNDNVSYVLSEKLSFYCIVLFTCLADHHKLHMIRHHGKGIHLPFHIFFVIFLRIGQGYKMSQRPGNYIIFSLKTAVSLLAAMKDPGNISCNRRLFRNY